MTGKVTILGVFAADLTFRAPRQPKTGETLIASDFAIGPGGKGSNQAVAATRAGVKTTFLTKLGSDTFGELALNTWQAEGVIPLAIKSELPTAAAGIIINETTGDNAIVIYPGSAGSITPADIEANAEAITSADIFVTQLEQPHDAALCALKIARKAGVITVFNPAPALAPIDEEFFQFSDYIIPNESEAFGLTGIEVVDEDSAQAAVEILLGKGVQTAVITLGANGVLIRGKAGSGHCQSFKIGEVVETTGAGDAFVGAFVAALATGQDPQQAVRFGCAAAGISVTRRGTSQSTPRLAEILQLLAD